VNVIAPSSANDQLLYFTSPSLTVDGRRLVVISDRGDQRQPNLFSVDRQTGAAMQLTDNRAGRLRSYVYFDGNDRRGLGLASPSLHAATGVLYYIEGLTVRSVDVYTGQSRTIAELPADEMTAFTHISDDGRWLCVPTIDRRAFEHDGKAESYDRTVQSLGLSSHIRVFDTATGRQALDLPVDRGWVTHVQFRPRRPEQILFNHEYCTDAGVRRMWLWDGQSIRSLRSESSQRRRADWVCHEIWTHDGNHVLYHGRYADGPAFVGRLHPDGDACIEIALPARFTRYGHFTASPRDDRLVTDGYYESPDEANTGWGGRWISVVTTDWSARTLQWSPLCQHGSSWRSQDEHPHPVFSHDASEVLFTSDRSGSRQVYAVPSRGS
jgi:oligogalacturonide lyase